MQGAAFCRSLATGDSGLSCVKSYEKELVEMSKRIRWSDEEVAILQDGMDRHNGEPQMWALIVREGKLPRRSAVDLKDKARNLQLAADPHVQQERRVRDEARAQALEAERQVEIEKTVEGLIRALEDEMLMARYAIARRRVDGVDPAKELYHLVHSRMYKAGVRGVNVAEALGCTLPYFAEYMEAKFEVGMTWENRGRREGLLGWELDHIVPLASFDLPMEWREAFHYSNCQPLWSADNMRKGTK